MIRTAEPTFVEIAELEPRLHLLRDEAREYQRCKGEVFCATTAWYGWYGIPGIEPRLRRLVGEQRPGYHRLLVSSAALDVACDTTLDELPPCRNCQGCTRSGIVLSGKQKKLVADEAADATGRPLTLPAAGLLHGFLDELRRRGSLTSEEAAAEDARDLARAQAAAAAGVWW